MRVKLFLIIGVSGVLGVWFGGWMLYDLQEVWRYFIPRTYTHILLFSCSIFILGLCSLAIYLKRSRPPSEIEEEIQKADKRLKGVLKVNPEINPSSLEDKIDMFSDKLSDLHAFMNILSKKSQNQITKLQDIDSRLTKIEREETDRELLKEVPEEAKKMLAKPEKKEKKDVRKTKKST